MTRTVAIDIGGTMIKHGIVDNLGCIVEASELATEAYKGGPGILQKVCQIMITI